MTAEERARVYQAGREDALRELRTAASIAAELGATRKTVITRAQRRGVGRQLDGNVWVFLPEDVAILREPLPIGRPKTG